MANTSPERNIQHALMSIHGGAVVFDLAGFWSLLRRCMCAVRHASEAQMTSQSV